MKVKNNEKGITLAVLVITIIVLIILAGTSLTLGIGGSNGVLQEASNQTIEQNKTMQNISSTTNEILNTQEQEWGLN